MTSKLFTLPNLASLILGILLGHFFSFEEPEQANVIMGDSSISNEVQPNNIIEELQAKLSKLETENEMLKSTLRKVHNELFELSHVEAGPQESIQIADKTAESFSLEPQIAFNPIQQYMMTNKQIESSLPAPFSEYVTKGANLELKKKYANYVNEETNANWAFETQNKLEDFILTSDDSHKIELQSVSCKSTTCEIKGFERERNSWGNVMDKLQLHGVGSFSDVHSASEVSKDGLYYFYALLSQ